MKKGDVHKLCMSPFFMLEEGGETLLVSLYVFQ